MNKNFYVLFLLLSVFISAFSQILLKKSALKIHTSFIKEYLNPLVISAYFLFFLAVFIDLFSLKYVPASFIPIIETSSYIFILILSRLFFKEKINLIQSIAIFLILLGIFIYII